MAVLVTGGAGYIGSVFVEQLLERGEQVVVLDDLSQGHRAAVDPRAAFHAGQVGDRALVGRIVREQRVTSAVHFAALASVAESMREPARYYENNFSQAAALFETLAAGGVKHVVFSSTCATYGVPREVPIPERHPQWPISPYGWSKLLVERLLADFDRAYGVRFVALRYFNAAGASERYGEHHEPETHLIPLVLGAASGRRERVSVFGDDYDTPDRTAIRDYIHVLDLGEAHLLALAHLQRGGASELLNLGTGTGHSVLAVIEAASRVTGKDVPHAMAPRREGDPPRLVADPARARQVLGWAPRRPRLDEIIRSAWEWMRAHPSGYPD
jgi:UDP-glucose 4-epimerase